MGKLILPCLGRATSRIGFGCGRLAGGADFTQSAKIVETALELGIRYFDVAPSYGLGMAEDVLGSVLGGAVTDVIVATKVGISRPVAGGGLSILRKYLGPVLRRSVVAKDLALRILSHTVSHGKFAVADVEASLVESLRRLKREKVDVLLLHEPGDEVINPDILDWADEKRRRGLVSLFGVGVNDAETDRFGFGDVYQSRWDIENDRGLKTGNKLRIYHGVLRFFTPRIIDELHRRPEVRSALSDELSCDLDDESNIGALALAYALFKDEDCLVLVSFTNPEKMVHTITLTNHLVTKLDKCKTMLFGDSVIV